MNKLPDHRRAVHGRTWGRSWTASDFDPITRPLPGWRFSRAVKTLALLALFAVLGAMLAHGGRSWP